jgi:hypothetical protein
VWTHTTNNLLVNELGSCLTAGATDGALVTVNTCGAAGLDQQWVFAEVANTSGADTWAAWFVPYLQLIGRPNVKAACYINWNWRAHSNHHGFNWYDWGDSRVERNSSTLIGGQWRRAMGGSGIINALPRNELYKVLRINGRHGEPHAIDSAKDKPGLREALPPLSRVGSKMAAQNTQKLAEPRLHSRSRVHQHAWWQPQMSHPPSQPHLTQQQVPRVDALPNQPNNWHVIQFGEKANQLYSWLFEEPASVGRNIFLNNTGTSKWYNGTIMSMPS